MIKRLCVIVALLLLLTACAQREESGTHNIFELTFSERRVSGSGDRWQITYLYQDMPIESGHRLFLSRGVFMFLGIEVELTEAGAAENRYTELLCVGAADGASETVELAVTDSSGQAAIFAVTCTVKKVGTGTFVP